MIAISYTVSHVNDDWKYFYWGWLPFFLCVSYLGEKRIWIRCFFPGFTVPTDGEIVNGASSGSMNSNDVGPTGAISPEPKQHHQRYYNPYNVHHMKTSCLQQKTVWYLCLFTFQKYFRIIYLLPFPILGTGWLNSFISRWLFSTCSMATDTSLTAVAAKWITWLDRSSGGCTAMPWHCILKSLLISDLHVSSKLNSRARFGWKMISSFMVSRGSSVPKPSFGWTSTYCRWTQFKVLKPSDTKDLL